MGDPGLFAACALLGTLSGGIALTLRIAASVQASLAGVSRIFHSGVLFPGLLLAAFSVSFGVTFGLLAVHASRRGVANPGLASVTLATAQILAQTVLRRASDRLGRRAEIRPGFLLVAAGMWTMAGATGLWVLVGGLLLGLGLGSAVPTIYALGSDLVSSDERGRAMGTLGVFLEIGIATGSIGGGAIGQAFGLTTTFVLAGCVCPGSRRCAVGDPHSATTATLHCSRLEINKTGRSGVVADRPVCEPLLTAIST